MTGIFLSFFFGGGGGVTADFKSTLIFHEADPKLLQCSSLRPKSIGLLFKWRLRESERQLRLFSLWFDLFIWFNEAKSGLCLLERMAKSGFSFQQKKLLGNLQRKKIVYKTFLFRVRQHFPFFMVVFCTINILYTFGSVFP